MGFRLTDFRRALPRPSRYAIAVCAALAVALAVRWYIVWQPVPELIARYNADDAYYYLTIARQVATGHGVTFDGLAPTNGFHPLYLTLIVPLFWIFPNQPDLTVHLAFSLLMVFNVLTAVVLYGILQRAVSRMAGLVATVAWLFNPWVVLIAVEGVESSIYIFFLALTVYLYVNYRAEGMCGAISSGAAAMGVTMGLTLLARSEGILLLPALLLDMVICRRREWLNGPILVFVIFTGLVCAPWMLWNLVTFGSFIQVSGAAIFLGSHAGKVQSWGTILDTIRQSSGLMLAITLVMIFQLYFVVLPLLSVLLIPNARRHVAARVREKGRDMLSVWFLVLYALFVFGFYAWYLVHHQQWYLTGIIFAASAAVGIVSDLFIASAGRRAAAESRLGTAIISILLMLFGLFAWMWQAMDFALYPAQLGGYQVAQWFARETEPQARVGAWNSGIIGYYSERTTVNLDGVVNNSLYQYVSSRNASFEFKDIWGYIQENHVDYITDYEDSLPAAMDTEFAGSLKQVYRFRNTYNGKYDIRVYRVTRPSDNPPASNNGSR